MSNNLHEMILLSLILALRKLEVTPQMFAYLLFWSSMHALQDVIVIASAFLSLVVPFFTKCEIQAQIGFINPIYTNYAFEVQIGFINLIYTSILPIFFLGANWVYKPEMYLGKCESGS